MPTQPVIVAAIDIRNEETGYAFSFISEPSNIRMKKWDFGTNSGYRSQTCVLVGPQGDLVEFGDKAENSYRALRENGQGDAYHLFKNFLGNLDDTKLVTTSMRATATDETEIPLIDLIAMSLQFLKSDLIESVTTNLTNKRVFEEDLIHWVIIFPVTWNDDAKPLMKKAAINANLVHSNGTIHNLTLIEDTLATAVCCKELEATEFINSDSEEEEPLSKEKDVLVVHSGETTFLTTHVTWKYGIATTTAKRIGSAGSLADIGKKLKAILSSVFGCNFIESYLSESPELWKMWKESFTHSSTQEEFKFSLPYSFVSDYKKSTVLSVEETLRQHTHLGITFTHGILIFSKKAVAIVLDPMLKSCAEMIKWQLKDTKQKPVSYIIFTGQLSSSLYFRDNLGKILGEEYKLLVPYDSSLCPVKGAVLYGHSLVRRCMNDGQRQEEVRADRWNVIYFIVVPLLVLVMAYIVAMIYL